MEWLAERIKITLYYITLYQNITAKRVRIYM